LVAQQIPTLYLIDLHRARRHLPFPTRWRVKDMAGLYFSAMDAGLTRRDLLRAMAIYTGKPWRQTLVEDKNFWQVVSRRADRLYQRETTRTDN
jgi:heptose I phosphotransferase